MTEENENVCENTPLLPVHTRQAARAIGILLFFSFLMFTLPFAVFFATKYLLQDYFHIVGFANTAWSVALAVVMVNLIICAYAYIGYNEPEYDEEGNPIIEHARETLVKKDL